MVLAGAAVLLATAAAAEGRPSTTGLTCRQAVSIVSSRGAVVLGTGGHSFDRFVRDRGFCEITESVRRAFVPTRDVPQCFVGYRCFEPSRDDAFETF